MGFLEPKPHFLKMSVWSNDNREITRKPWSTCYLWSIDLGWWKFSNGIFWQKKTKKCMVNRHRSRFFKRSQAKRESGDTFTLSIQSAWVAYLGKAPEQHILPLCCLESHCTCSTPFTGTMRQFHMPPSVDMSAVDGLGKGCSVPFFLVFPSVLLGGQKIPLLNFHQPRSIDHN